MAYLMMNRFPGPFVWISEKVGDPELAFIIYLLIYMFLFCWVAALLWLVWDALLF